jgi:hypothetical protein
MVSKATQNAKLMEQIETFVFSPMNVLEKDENDTQEALRPLREVIALGTPNVDVVLPCFPKVRWLTFEHWGADGLDSLMVAVAQNCPLVAHLSIRGMNSEGVRVLCRVLEKEHVLPNFPSELNKKCLQH